ncbi:altered inheritance rate of mitochondria protein 29 [[Candida] railenensis]|uniref:Altered inheritance rate of mitochondria protein 29 n=1 Tax=[Candida] railenensis TaxID=45579 RepID=A0A9P0QMA6_9ASCO|nr:altered inheritance rate of mitochondria protein 29 [[Candida] railenensis]
MDYDTEEPLTSNVRPPTDSLLTIRIIKSFPYRNVKNHILPSVDLKSTTPQQLLEKVQTVINTTGGLRPYRNIIYNTVKVYSKAHGSKSMNLVINFEQDEELVLVCEDEDNQRAGTSKTLWDLGVENETELSVFNWGAYVEFKKNPEEKW